MNVVSRAGPDSVALETTLLLHGVPKAEGAPLARKLSDIVRSKGAKPATVGVIEGRPTVGLTDDELTLLLKEDNVPKANTSNLGLLIHRKSHAATTVSTTMELAAAAGVPVFATGGIGGVHRGYGEHLDISADLAAFTRFPVAVVTSGVKSILDVAATRELLESLGVPVIGFRTDTFPQFYLRESDIGVDDRFDSVDELASFVNAELPRGRGIIIANPIPKASEIAQGDWDRWFQEAQDVATMTGIRGRAYTPFILAALHRFSGGATLRANLDLVESNAALAGELCHAMSLAKPSN